jgi:hypothetical protein
MDRHREAAEVMRIFYRIDLAPLANLKTLLRQHNLLNQPLGDGVNCFVANATTV